MHVLYVHKSFPAQFGHIADRLIKRHGFRCSFVTEKHGVNSESTQIIPYRPRGGATHANHFASRSFENFTCRSHAVLEAVKQRADIRPDLIVGHSGFGSTLFLGDFYDRPVVNFCEWYYRNHGSDMECLLGSSGAQRESHRLVDRCRNAMLLADLDTATLAYTPTNWQRSRIPHAYQHKLETIFDGIDTDFWRPITRRERGFGRWIGKHWLPWRKRVVTYVSRGFESMRGFDVFMQIAKRICEKRSDVVFLCIGSDQVHYGGDHKYIGEKTFREHVLKSGNYNLDRFIFTGRIPPAELRRAFAFSDLHIYLTVPFILSWSLMDALACGCTVLVSDTPPLREVIEHGQNGLMAPYFDVEHMAELALQVLDDPAEFRRTLGQNGLETIHNDYDLDVVLPKMIKLYERAIQGDVPLPGTSAHRMSSSQESDSINTVLSQPYSSLKPSNNGNGPTKNSPIESLKRKYPWPRSEVGEDHCIVDDGWLRPPEVDLLRTTFHQKTKVILELGAWRGQTTRFLAEQCPHATIVAVDTWSGGRIHEGDHPDWKALLPDVWRSFAHRMHGHRDRVIAMRQRYAEAVRELANLGIAPDAIYFDPDYHSGELRQTLAAIVQSFPHTLLVGHNWLWHAVQREVSRVTRRTGRRLA